LTPALRRCILTVPVRHLPAILLALAFLALGSGAAARWHDAVHAHEDAAAADHHHGPGDRHPPVHDDTNCLVHAQLSGPLVAGQAVPALIADGVFVAFVTQLAPRLRPQLVPARIRCRGPPVR
jgi:hypothetical protein